MEELKKYIHEEIKEENELIEANRNTNNRMKTFHQGYLVALENVLEKIEELEVENE